MVWVDVLGISQQIQRLLVGLGYLAAGKKVPSGEQALLGN